MQRFGIGRAAVLAALVAMWAAPAAAGYPEGQKAWDAGRHAEALAEWRAAANAGDARAMLALGRLYEQGLGAPQNFVQAHMWFNLAAAQGSAEAAAARSALTAQMTREQVATAQAGATAWKPAGAAATSASVGGSGNSVPSPDATREVQTLLTSLGYRPGPADGIWGRRTAEAYQSFLRDADLPVAETPTPDALRQMRSAANKRRAVEHEVGKVNDNLADKAADAAMKGAEKGGRKAWGLLEKSKKFGKAAWKARKRWAKPIKQGLRLAGPAGRVVDMFDMSQTVGTVLYKFGAEPLIVGHLNNMDRKQNEQLQKDRAEIRRMGEDRRKAQDQLDDRKAADEKARANAERAREEAANRERHAAAQQRYRAAQAAEAERAARMRREQRKAFADGFQRSLQKNIEIYSSWKQQQDREAARTAQEMQRRWEQQQAEMRRAAQEAERRRVARQQQQQAAHATARRQQQYISGGLGELPPLSFPSPFENKSNEKKEKVCDFAANAREIRKARRAYENCLENFQPPGSFIQHSNNCERQHKYTARDIATCKVFKVRKDK